MQFKKGDKVKLLSSVISTGVEPEEIGKIGTISFIDNMTSEWYGYMIQMEGVCKARGYIPCWSVGISMIELIPKKNQQLLFDFMKD